MDNNEKPLPQAFPVHPNEGIPFDPLSFSGFSTPRSGSFGLGFGLDAFELVLASLLRLQGAVTEQLKLPIQNFLVHVLSFGTLPQAQKVEDFETSPARHC